MGAPKPFPTRWPEPNELPDYDSPHEEQPEEQPSPEEIPNVDPNYWPEMRSGPSAVTWAITNPCNLRCTHCYDATAEKRKDMPTDKAIKIINWLRDAGVRFIVFSGGEPLLRRDLLELMAYCQSMQVGFGMRTNATMIREGLPGKLGKLGIGVVGTSLDGASKETHDHIRGVGRFQETIKGIQALVSEGIRVNIEVVLGKHNMHEAAQFVKLAENLGVAEINFSALTPQGRGVALEHLFLDHVTWKNLVQDMREISKLSRIAVSPSCALVGNCVACVEPNITRDGWVTPCYLSSRKLLEILSVQPKEFGSILTQSRISFQNVCGRNRWIFPTEEINVLNHMTNDIRNDAGSSVSQHVISI